jgi:Kef-type K+ transport system membrane component KefB/nucleotide-binding universal stress UspA family protein
MERAKRILGAYGAALPLLVVVSGAAWAAEGNAGPSEVIFIFQMMLLIFVGRSLGEIFQRMGQPAVTGQLVAGIVLGPTVLGALWPDAQHWLFPPGQKEQKAMLDAVSQVGILMLLLLTGMETDLRLVRRAGRAAASVSLMGIVVPFACGFALGEFLPDSMIPNPQLRIVTSLFLGTALSIASIKIVAMVVREMNYMRRNLGQIIVSSAIIDDSVGWIIISVIFSLAQHGAVDFWSVGQGVVGTLIFLAVSLTIGRRAVFFIMRWTNDNFVSEVPVVSAVLLIMGGMALITHFIGVHTVLGAFVAGVLVGESPILTRHIDEQLRGMITAFFAPIFFGAAGLGTDLTILKDPHLLALTAGLVLIASVGKFGGAFVGGEIGGLSRRESLALALGMNARGSTEVIIATIGLSLGALTQNLFSMIVAMAVITTMAMPPTLRWALRRVPLRKEEEERLDREAFAERGFVTNLERLLLAVDDSPNGKFAARIAGLLAGPVGMPTTILHIDKKIAFPKRDDGAVENSDKAPEKSQGEPPLEKETNAEAGSRTGKNRRRRANAKAAKTKEAKVTQAIPVEGTEGRPDLSDESKEAEGKAALEAAVEKTKAAEAALKSAAEKSKPMEDDAISSTVDVTVTIADRPPREAIEAEAKKGYDLLLVGLSKPTSISGVFSRAMSEIAAGFESPIGVAIARGRLEKRPAQSRFKILVPVTGTGVSRRGAEVGLAMARASRSEITALFVRSGSAAKARRRRLRQALATRRSERAIMKDIASMGDNFETPIKIYARTDDAPAAAILREARRGGYDLIVMGVSRRPGERLFFGNVSQSLLENDEFSILFVASEAYAAETRPAEKEEVAR